MSNKEDIKFEWWKLACEKNPDPVSFVDLEDRFVFCNNAWCKLLGYSESELKQKTWQEITISSDIGGDQAEVNSIKSGEKEDYYLEKHYIKRDGSVIAIDLYVHKYPESGDHKGYVVFAKRTTSKDYEDLKSKFLDLQKTVLILQQNAISNKFITEQMKFVEQKLQQNKELATMAIERSNNINIGDKFGDSSNKAGRDNIHGLSTNNLLIVILLIFSFALFLVVGSIVLYLIINKPAILMTGLCKIFN